MQFLHIDNMFFKHIDNFFFFLPSLYEAYFFKILNSLTIDLDIFMLLDSIFERSSRLF